MADREVFFNRNSVEGIDGKLEFFYLERLNYFWRLFLLRNDYGYLTDNDAPEDRQNREVIGGTLT